MASLSVFILLIATLVICTVNSKNSVESTNDPMENPDLFEGDILGIDPYEDRNAVVDKKRLWPNGIIPYIIDPDLKKQEKVIEKAMEHYKENTCIRFVPRTDEEDYIWIYPGNGCFSYVGRIRPNQTLSLGWGCYEFGTMVHELGHAVGFYHEHTRSDRDDYLNIHYENIMPGTERQFKKLYSFQNQLLTPFDYKSIMLYGELTFSKDKSLGLKTMTAKDGTKLLENYLKKGLSQDDIRRISLLYEC